MLEPNFEKADGLGIRLINQSFYQEILLLQKFNDIGGKVLKPKNNSASNLKKIK